VYVCGKIYVGKCMWENVCTWENVCGEMYVGKCMYVQKCMWEMYVYKVKMCVSKKKYVDEKCTVLNTYVGEKCINVIRWKM